MAIFNSYVSHNQRVPGTVAQPYKFAGKRSTHSNFPPCGPHLPDMVGASYQNQPDYPSIALFPLRIIIIILIYIHILTLIIFIYVIIIDYIIYNYYYYYHYYSSYYHYYFYYYYCYYYICILYIYHILYYISTYIYIYISRMENFKKVWSSCFASPHRGPTLHLAHHSAPIFGWASEVGDEDFWIQSKDSPNSWIWSFLLFAVIVITVYNSYTSTSAYFYNIIVLLQLIRVPGYPTWQILVSRSESTQKRSKHFHDKQI